MVVTLEKLIELPVMLYEHLIGSAGGPEARNGWNIISNVMQELDQRGIVRHSRHAYMAESGQLCNSRLALPGRHRSPGREAHTCPYDP